MRALLTAASALLAAVALAAVMIGWLETADPLSERGALDAASRALEEAGVDARLAPRASEGVYRPEGGGEVQVWRTVAEVDGAELELWLARDDGEAVFLDDRSAEGTSHLLTDEQFEALAAHDADPVHERQLRRNLAATAAGAGIVLAAVVLATTRLATTRSP